MYDIYIDTDSQLSSFSTDYIEGLILLSFAHHCKTQEDPWSLNTLQDKREGNIT